MNPLHRLRPWLALLALGAAMAPAQAEEGAQIFKNLCMQCHKMERGPNMIAPPIFGVKNHYLQAFPDRARFVARVREWVVNPDVTQTQMPGAIRRFNVMPAQQLSRAQAQAVAEFLYDTDFSTPSWYAKHYEAEHGKPPRMGR